MSASNDSPLLVTSAKANRSATLRESWKKETTFWVTLIRKGETLKIFAFFSLNFSHKDITSFESHALGPTYGNDVLWVFGLFNAATTTFAISWVFI